MLTIIIGAGMGKSNHTWSTTLHRWYAETRPTLFNIMKYAEVPASSIKPYAIPKYGDTKDISIGEKLSYVKRSLGSLFVNSSEFPVLYNRSFLYWFKSFTFFPNFFSTGSGKDV